MRLRISKLFFSLMVFAGTLSVPAFAINLQPGFDTGPLAASQVTPSCQNWTKNLSCADNNQQAVDDVVDQLSTGGISIGTTVPAGAIANGVVYTNGSKVLSENNGFIYDGANVGIGTTNPQGGLVVMNGNVGIGTWVPRSTLQIVGNVGIGSTAPGGALDVGSGSICLGHTCDSAWPSGGGSDYWNYNTNVGIGTTANVGIGTITPTDYLNVQSGSSGGVTINGVPSGIGGIDGNTLLMLQLNSNLTDMSQYNVTMSSSNITYSNSSPEYAGTYYAIFNGSTSTLATPYYFSLGTGNFTMEAWVKFSSLADTDDYIFGTFNAGYTAGFQMYIVASTGQVIANCYNGSQFANIASSSNLTVNQWNHVAWVRNESTFTLYINGTSVGTASSSNAVGDSGTGVGVGVLWVAGASGGSPLNGYMQGVRISSSARWTTNFTPPTTPYTTSIASPQLTFNSSGTQEGFIKSNATDAYNLELGNGSSSAIAITASENIGIGTIVSTSKMQFGGTCKSIGPVGACWTSTGQLGYCSGALNVCTTCTAC